MTKQHSNKSNSELELATFGAGCFWCVEAVYRRVEGIAEVTSGYMNGHVENPTYREICQGDTGHAEVTQIRYAPDVISYSEILDIFWQLHDPTTLNRQGADCGTQYRSAIFFHTDDQRKIAIDSKNQIEPKFSDPIVTEITQASVFYPAEPYHQDYYQLNSNASYCRFVIHPKLKKLGLE